MKGGNLMREIMIPISLVLLAVGGYYLLGRLEFFVKPRKKSKDKLDDHAPYRGK